MRELGGWAGMAVAAAVMVSGQERKGNMQIVTCPAQHCPGMQARQADCEKHMGAVKGVARATGEASGRENQQARLILGKGAGLPQPNVAA